MDAELDLSELDTEVQNMLAAKATSATSDDPTMLPIPPGSERVPGTEQPAATAAATTTTTTTAATTTTVTSRGRLTVLGIAAAICVMAAALVVALRWPSQTDPEH